MSKIEILNLWVSVSISALFLFACGNDTATGGKDATDTRPENRTDSSIDGINADSASASDTVVAEASAGDAAVVEASVADTAVANAAINDAAVEETTVADALVSDTGQSPIPYQGFEDFYIMTSDDDPVDVCRVRYELIAVDEPAIACAGCDWDIVVERRNPSVLTDVDGACENSDLALDEASIAAKEWERIAYGYIDEYIGHAHVFMRFNEDLGKWEAVANANLNKETGEFFYDRRDGFCGYGGSGAAFEYSGICGLSGEAVVKN